MALDSILLRALTQELKNRLVGARVEKAMQPERDIVMLTLRTPSGNVKLLLSAAAASARAHLTEIQLKNPDQAPMFCMLLRKHLVGGRIRDIVQQGFERVLELHIESADEMGDLSTKRLILEIMGKHSNMMLVGSNGQILDCVRRVTEEMSSLREVLPGIPYLTPPSQNKLNPLEVLPEQITAALIDKRGAAHKIICEQFMGISLPSAREIVYRTFGTTDKQLNDNDEAQRLAEELSRFFADIRNNQFNPCLSYAQDGTPADFFAMLYQSATNPKQADSFSTALDTFYAQREITRRIETLSRDMRHKVETLLDKARRKLEAQQQELTECTDAEEQKLFGDAIMSGIYLLKKGMTSAQLPDYSTGEEVQINVPLDPLLSPSENAQAYYKKYQRKKRAQASIIDRIRESEEDIRYFEGQAENILRCSSELELSEIREELARFGYVSRTGKPAKKTEISKPLHFISSNGIDIYVGKNNVQNDALTTSASPTNTWLHTKEIPGSHVIIRTKGEVPSETLYEAAMLAAYNSKARNSENVPVDYALKKHVRKPAGAKPGMVIYTDNRTLYVTPDADFIRGLRLGD